MTPSRRTTVLVFCNLLAVAGGLLLVASAFSAFVLIEGIRAEGLTFARPLDILTPPMSLASGVWFLVLAAIVRRRVREALPKPA